jgi:hypothetical protein
MPTNDDDAMLNTEQARRLYLLTAVHRMWPLLDVDHDVQIARYLMTGTDPSGRS